MFDLRLLFVALVWGVRHLVSRLGLHRWVPAVAGAAAVFALVPLTRGQVAAWRDDESFALLDELFENPWQREVRPARLVAHEFQGQLSGRLEPLKARAERMLQRLDGPRGSRG